MKQTQENFLFTNLRFNMQSQFFQSIICQQFQRVLFLRSCQDSGSFTFQTNIANSVLFFVTSIFNSKPYNGHTDGSWFIWIILGKSVARYMQVNEDYTEKKMVEIR